MNFKSVKLGVIHIPKTAGTYLNDIFRYSLGSKFFHLHKKINLDDATPSWSNRLLKNEILDYKYFLKKTKVCSSHYMLYDENLFEIFPSMKFLTVIRNPKKRLISDYAHKCAIKNKLVDFDKWSKKRENLQTKMLSKDLNVESIIKKIKSSQLICLTTENIEPQIMQTFNLSNKSINNLKNIKKSNVKFGSKFYDKSEKIISQKDIGHLTSIDEELYAKVIENNFISDNFLDLIVPNALQRSQKFYVSKVTQKISEILI